MTNSTTKTSAPPFPPWTDPLWDARLSALSELSASCRICPRACKVDRTTTLGVCRAPAELYVSSINLHTGEEPPISGERGSGTVFLSWCNLRCAFCQNYPISAMGVGKPTTAAQLAQDMLGLQKRGAHNINFVSPTQYSHLVAEAIVRARRAGLRVPIVWNSNGYESLETLRLMDGLVEVYLPDIKYSEEEPAVRLSGAPHYFETAQAATIEMNRQVGVLTCGDDGIAVRGLLIRHLVLPGGLAGSRRVLKFIARKLGTDTHLSLMSQYFPANRAPDMPEISRRINSDEYREALDALEEFGLENGFAQDEDLEQD